VHMCSGSSGASSVSSSDVRVFSCAHRSAHTPWWSIRASSSLRSSSPRKRQLQSLDHRGSSGTTRGIIRANAFRGHFRRNTHRRRVECADSASWPPFRRGAFCIPQIRSPCPFDLRHAERLEKPREPLVVLGCKLLDARLLCVRSSGASGWTSARSRIANELSNTCGLPCADASHFSQCGGIRRDDPFD
jgi:hypothetical protein